MAGYEKITDLIDKKAFEQVQKLTADLVSMNGTMDQSIMKTLEIAKATGGKTFKDVSTSVKDLTKAEKDLTDQLIKKEKLQQEIQKTVIGNIRVQKAQQAESVKLAKAAAEEGSAYKQLSNRLNELRGKYKDAAAAGQAHTKEAKAMLREVNNLDKQIKSIDGSVGQFQRNVGNYASAMKGLGSQLLMVTGITAGVAGAFKLFSGVINSVDSLSDKAAASISGVKDATGFLARSLATLDFSNLIQGLRQAYQEGYRYSLELDKIANFQRALGLTKGKYDIEIAELKIIAKNRGADLKDRQAAVDKIIELENKKLNETKNITDMDLANQLNHAKSISGLDQKTIRGLIEGNIQYNDALEKGAALRAKLRREATTTVRTKEGMEAAVFSVAAYDAALSKLTQTDQAWIRMADGFNKLTDEEGGIRDKIAKAIQADQAATLDNIEGRASLIRTTNALITAEENLADEKKKNAKMSGTVTPMPSIAGGGTQATLALMKEDAALQVSVDEALTGKKKTEMEKRLALTEQFYQDTALALNGANAEQLAALEAQFEAIKEKYGLTFENITGILGTFSQADYERKRGMAEQELEALDEMMEQELERAGDNADAKKAIEEKYAAQKEAINKKIKKAEYDKALMDRILATATVIFNTAQAIMKAVAASPLTGGLPWSAIAGAMGAAEIAVINAAPLPKYAKGRRGGKGEFAIVGEAGAELVTSGGEAHLVSKPSLTYLPKGADVISNADLMTMAGSIALTSARGRDATADMEIIYNGAADRIIEAIKDKEEFHLNITEAGMQAMSKRGHSWTEYINSNIRR